MVAITSRETIAHQAAAAAERYVRTGQPQANDYPAGTDAHVEWHKRFEIALLRLSVPAQCEGAA